LAPDASISVRKAVISSLSGMGSPSRCRSIVS